MNQRQQLAQPHQEALRLTSQLNQLLQETLRLTNELVQKT